jgi:iron complex transport system ATP-binding protein
VTPPAALRASGLAIGHGKRVLARGIDLAIEPGTVTCLLGPNGAGKTTLFRTLLGLSPPLAGTVSIGGRPLAALSRKGFARAVAYVPQAHAGPFPYTARDLVLMGRTAHLDLFEQPGRQDAEIAHRALDALGIGGLAGQTIDRLSGGQRQLVFIARALAQRAPIVVMDEPAASLDIANRLMLRCTIRRLAGEGLGIIVSTHEPDEAFALADAAALIGPAGFAAGPAAEVLTESALSVLYGVPLRVETTASGRRVVTAARG